MAVAGNHGLLVLSLLVLATTLVSAAGIPGSNETWTPAVPVDCTTFNASTPCQFSSDRKVYCLNDGSIVTGLCAVHTAQCLKNVSVEGDISMCSNSVSNIIPQKSRAALESSTIIPQRSRAALESSTTIPQRSRAALESSTSTSSTAPPAVSSPRASLNAGGRGSQFGESVFQSVGAPLNKTSSAFSVEGKSSSARSTTMAILSGSNRSSSEIGGASSSTRMADTRAMSLSSDGTSTSTTSTPSTTTKNLFNNHETFTTRETFTNREMPTNNETSTNREIFNNRETPTNNETTINMNETSINNDRNKPTSSSTSMNNNVKDSFNVDAASFSNSKPFGSGQTLSDDKTQTGDSAPPASSNNTVAGLHTATWHVSLASLTFATVHAVQHIVFY